MSPWVLGNYNYLTCYEQNDSLVNREGYRCSPEFNGSSAWWAVQQRSLFQETFQFFVCELTLRDFIQTLLLSSAVVFGISSLLTVLTVYIQTRKMSRERRVWRATKALGKNRTGNTAVECYVSRHHLIFMYMPLKLPPIISQISHASYWAEQLWIKALWAVRRPCTNWAVDVLPCCTVTASVYFSTM